MTYGFKTVPRYNVSTILRDTTKRLAPRAAACRVASRYTLPVAAAESEVHKKGHRTTGHSAET